MSTEELREATDSERPNPVDGSDAYIELLQRKEDDE